MAFSNKKFMIAIAALLAACIFLSFCVIANHGNLVKDGWFVPILLAQLWTVCVTIRDY